MATIQLHSGKHKPSLRERMQESLFGRLLGSFRARLNAGFAGIALLTLFATGFALYSFNQFGEIVNVTAGEAIPELMAVMRLSESSALLVAVAPVLAAASGEADLREAENRVESLVDAINRSSEQLSSAHQNGTFDDLKSHSAKLLATLTDIEDATLRRISLGERRLLGLTALREVQGELADILNPVIYGATSLSNLLARRGGRRNAAALRQLIEGDAALLTAALELQGAVQRMATILETSHPGNQSAAIEDLRKECQSAEISMASSIDSLEGLADGPELVQVLARGRALSAMNPCDGSSFGPGWPQQADQLNPIRALGERLTPLIAHYREQLQSNYALVRQQVRSTPQFLARGVLRDFHYALDLKAEANQLIGLLTAATYADDKHTVTNLLNRYRGSLIALGKAVEVFESSELAGRNPVLAGQVLELERRLVAFAAGDKTLFNTRQQQLTVAERIRALLATHRAQANLLTGTASRLVGAVKADVSALRSKMASTQVTAVSILVAVWFGSLVIASLIAYFSTQTLSRHESDLRDAKNTAELINQELEAFNYSVSHDLRAPLRTLSGFSQALLEDYHHKLDGEGKDYLNYLQEGSREMGELIDGLLKLSRSTRGDMSIEEVNLSELARAVSEGLSRSHPDRQVICDVAPGLRTRADRRLIKVVLDNLFANAWKYTAKKPCAWVEFGATSKNGETVFFLRDNGAGFDMAHAAQLFQPFQRLHPVGEFEGTGIGLATVQRIIRRHGGLVWAQAQPGKGATLFFTLAAKETRS